MRRTIYQWFILGVFTLAIFTNACKEGGIIGGSSPKNLDDSISYAIGLSIGKNIGTTGTKINPSFVAKGIRETLEKKTPSLSDEQIERMIMTFERNAQTYQQEQFMKKAEENEAKGIAFLAENKAKNGVTELASGLQYKVLKTGTGELATATDTVVVRYKGTLIDGTEFDNSENSGGPVTFPVNIVISGWQEALQLMRPGDNWMLYIPSKLAYGARGGGELIGPNEALIFDIELLEVKRDKTAAKK